MTDEQSWNILIYLPEQAALPSNLNMHEISNDLFVFALQIHTLPPQFLCIAHVFDNTWPAAPKGRSV